MPAAPQTLADAGPLRLRYSPDEDTGNPYARPYEVAVADGELRGKHKPVASAKTRPDAQKLFARYKKGLPTAGDWFQTSLNTSGAQHPFDVRVLSVDQKSGWARVQVWKPKNPAVHKAERTITLWLLVGEGQKLRRPPKDFRNESIGALVHELGKLLRK